MNDDTTWVQGSEVNSILATLSHLTDNPFHALMILAATAKEIHRSTAKEGVTAEKTANLLRDAFLEAEYIEGGRA